MDKNEITVWEIVGYVKISQARYKTLETLEKKYLMPSEIAKKTNFKTTQISSALHDLKEKKLVECVNENNYKGRIYKNTELGLTVLKKIKEQE